MLIKITFHMLISEMSHTPAFLHCLNSRQELIQISILVLGSFKIKHRTFIFGVLSEFVTAEKLACISEFLILYCELLLMEESKKISQEETCISSIGISSSIQAWEDVVPSFRFLLGTKIGMRRSRNWMPKIRQ